MSAELTISEQGQIADRYDAAVEKLVDDSVDVRRGAIYSMQSIMTDSPRMQPAVIDMLSKYVRDRATKTPVLVEKAPDIRAALYTLGNRDPSHDGKAVIDLGGVRLRKVDLNGVDLTSANLEKAVLSDGDLEKADLSGADLESAVLTGVRLTGADLTNSYVKRADLRGADLTGADLSGADLTETKLARANLTGTIWKCTNLSGANRPEGDLPDVTSSMAPDRSRSPGCDGTLP
ncbi:pentapeptide repeat-containing protein [Streptomyces sp. NPDC004542]|uniref:pentapeptide repeat-containing protein n=1 Tax=Streptomyces sp. NPDC004542 TaxID=3154281 RepID=UPI0033BDBD44